MSSRPTADTDQSCDLVSCADPATQYVRHPNRPEPRTKLCAAHAQLATEETEAEPGGEL
jgi:hypothetical protein